MPRYIGPLSGNGGSAADNKLAGPLPSAKTKRNSESETGKTKRISESDTGKAKRISESNTGKTKRNSESEGGKTKRKSESENWADGRTFSECEKVEKDSEPEIEKPPPTIHAFEGFSNSKKGKKIVTTDTSLYVTRRNLWRASGDLKEELLGKLKPGQDYDGYIVKTKSSDYDYGTKLWDHGRVAPPDPFYPKDGEEVDALVIDRIGDHMLLGVGPHIAIASKEAFKKAGLDANTLKLPYGCIKVSLHPLCSSTRPKDLLIAAWTADLKPQPAKYSQILNF